MKATHTLVRRNSMLIELWYTVRGRVTKVGRNFTESVENKGLILDPSLLTVRWNGQVHKLRPKTFAVLEHLLAQRGRTLGKQELVAAVWRDVAVTDDVLVQSVTELRRVLEEDRGQPKVLVTVPRVGYRLLLPAVDVPVPVDSPPVAERRLVAVAAAAMVAVAVVALGIARIRSGNPEPVAGPLAVLPFENLSASQESDWLRDGLADMLITSLSQTSGLNVVSLQEIRSRLVRQPDAVALGRSLRAHGVVKGTFAVASGGDGGQLRVDVQLIDGATGRVTGGETLTVDSMDQLLTRFDSLSVGLASRLGRKHGGSLAGVMTGNLEAYRAYTLGLEKAAAFRNREAIGLFEKAAQLDPGFAMAHARIGYAYAVTWNLAPEARPHLERAYGMTSRLTPKDRKFIEGWYAIANLDFGRAVGVFEELRGAYPDETEAALRLGLLLRGEERFEDALRVARAALKAHPDDPEFYELEAGVLAQMGRHQDAIEAARRFVERLPRGSNAHDLLGEMYHWAGRADEAVASYKKAEELAPGFERPVVHLGNLYFQLGRYREALRQFERYIEMAPSDLERGRGWGRIAWLWWRKGDRAKAEAAAATELKLVPAAVWNSVVLALARGDTATVERLRKELDRQPYTSRGARVGQRYREYFEGYVALKLGRQEEALARLRKAVAHAAPYWSMEVNEDCLADALADLGRHEEASIEYRRALGMNPGNGFARYRLARSLEAIGDAAAAQREYAAFARLWKNADRDVQPLAGSGGDEVSAK
jgi:tetratricopeptide (TPR) repeat protein/DNA-binding winged helix-turn-helix (wHTH) protein/TolB-like protein